MKRRIFYSILLVLLLPVFSISAMDNGLTLNVTTALEDYGLTNQITDNIVFLGSLTPWLFVPFGDNAELYASVGITGEFIDKEWMLVPELLRTTYNVRFGTSSELTFGRMHYQDPLGFIASGLFDGVRYTQDIGDSVIGVSAFYTGFLNKKNAVITMTEADEKRHILKLNYSDFFNTYFASRRVVAAVDWEHPGISELVRLRAALIGQFDLNEHTSFNSQYLALKAFMPFGIFIYELGGSLGLIQDEGDFKVSLAGEIGVNIFLPTRIQDSLRISANYSSGVLNDTVTAFVPVTTVPQGNIIKAKFSGLSSINIAYTARLIPGLSLSLVNSYFIVNDMGSYWGLPYGRNGFFLGNEIYAQLVWHPFSDLQLRAGGGVFLQGLGNAAPNYPVMWKAELNIVFSIF